MKTSLKSYLYYLLVCISTSCSDDDQEPNGLATATMNGVSWEASGTARFMDYISGEGVGLSFRVFSQQGFQREFLSFGTFPKVNENYNVSQRSFLLEPEEWDKTSWYVTLSDDGDVLEDRFIVLESEANSLDITNLTSSEVTGNFEITFVRDTSFKVNNLSLADTLRFTGGQFTVYIEE